MPVERLKKEKMTKQNVVFSDAGALSKSSINMAITLTVPKSSIFPHAAVPGRKAIKKQQAVGGRINAWVDSMKASSPTHIKSPASLSAAPAEDHRSWLVGVS